MPSPAVQLDGTLWIEVIGVLGVAQQVAADLDRAPRRRRQDPGAVDRQAPLEIERRSTLDTQIAQIDQRPDLDVRRAPRDRQTQARR